MHFSQAYFVHVFISLLLCPRRCLWVIIRADSRWEEGRSSSKRLLSSFLFFSLLLILFIFPCPWDLCAYQSVEINSLKKHKDVSHLNVFVSVRRFARTYILQLVNVPACAWVELCGKTHKETQIVWSWKLYISKTMCHYGCILQT